MSSIDASKVQAQMAALDTQINEKKEIIKQLEIEVKELTEQRDRLKMSLTDAEYYNKVEAFLKNAEHYEAHRIDRQTSTRDMMTVLRRGSHESSTGTKTGKPVDFYILDNRFVVLYPRTHDIPRVETGGSITASAFKTEYGTLRNQPFTGIIVKLKNGQQVKLFVKPYAFNAQTYFDMDYRKEWQNGYMVYEGNNYGDTTTFYIVGELIGKYY